jgi:hypothetical protein
LAKKDPEQIGSGSCLLLGEFTLKFSLGEENS